MISLVICTKNEERNIERCLKSARDVVDEIIVVDSFSTDKTPQICQSFEGVKFHQMPWEGFSQTKNKANELAQFDYILSLDADEELSTEIQQEILQIKKNLKGLYRVNRLTNYCGSWVHHSGWFPDRHIRLFPKLGTRWVGDFVHEKLESSEKSVSDFKGLVYHYSIVSVPEHLKKIRSYSSLGAEQMMRKKISLVLFFSVILSPPARFLRHYIFKLGFLDGKAGFLISFLSAYSVYLKYSKAFRLKVRQS